MLSTGINTLATMTLIHAQNSYVAPVNPRNDFAWAEQGNKPTVESVL